MATEGSSYNFPNVIASLYSLWTLDGLVELAYAVSLDFVSRPESYVDANIPDVISDFRVSYGTDKEFQNTAERQAMVWPILGRSDWLKPDNCMAKSQFYTVRYAFLDACSDFSTKGVETRLEPLEAAVKQSLEDFRNYFSQVRGKSTDVASELLVKVSKHATDVLTADGVARVFGFKSAGQDWPFAVDSNIDPDANSNGAKLVQAIGTQLIVPADYKLTAIKFMQLQDVATQGALTLKRVLTTDPSLASAEDIRTLVSQAYTWLTSLQHFQGKP